ncbi:hypothetical protein [Propioniciclava sp.]|uniref:hypothetical protein n=1 Tax=Propioniciclava sp. TaxID=2038686 RepID=UPI002636EBA7|nr:hypothetical protein [Propioniciclava sp.]
MTNDRLDPITGRRVPGQVPEDALSSGAGSDRNYPDLGDVDPGVADPAYGLDDTEPVGDAEIPGQARDDVRGGRDDVRGGRDDVAGGGGDARAKAEHVAEHAIDKAADVKDTAVEKAADVKDAALERGADVADVARDELARLAGDARAQFQGLWDQASGQLREQASTGKQQLADLLHALAGELGEMASKSEQDGPVTALAKQASRRGGELSNWLANADASDVLAEVRRFARRRPFVFLAGATVAGVVVGRLSRGLMAGRDVTPSRSATAAAEATDVPAPRLAAEVPAYGGGTTGQTYGYDRADAGGDLR